MEYFRSLFNQPDRAPPPDLQIATKPLIQPKTSNESVRSRLSIPVSEPHSSDGKQPFIPNPDDQTSLKMTNSQDSTPSPKSFCSERSNIHLHTHEGGEMLGLSRSYTDPVDGIPLEIRLRRASRVSKDSSRRGSLLPFMVQGAHPRVIDEENQDILRKSQFAEPTTTLTTIAVINRDLGHNGFRKRRTSETYEVIWEGYYRARPSPREEVVPTPINTVTHNSSMRSSAEDDLEREMPVPLLAAQQLTQEAWFQPDAQLRRLSGSSTGIKAYRRRSSIEPLGYRKLSNLAADEESLLSHTDSIALGRERIAHDRATKLSKKRRAQPATTRMDRDHQNVSPKAGIMRGRSRSRSRPPSPSVSTKHVHGLMDDLGGDEFSER